MSSIEFQTALYEVEGAVATITINRPERRNFSTLPELTEALSQADSDSRVRVVVLTGAGEKRSAPAPTSIETPPVLTAFRSIRGAAIFRSF